MRSTPHASAAVGFGSVALALLLTAGPGLAQDAADFGAKFSAAYAYSGYRIEFGPGSGANGTITYDGISVATPDLGLFEPFRLDGPVVFSGVAATADGGYTAERLALPDLALDIEGVGLAATGLVIEKIAVPGAATLTARDAMGLVGSAVTGPVSVSFDGTTVVGISGSRATVERITAADGSEILETSSRADGLFIDLSGIDLPELQAGLAALGLGTITGSLDQRATWSLATGEMDIDRTALTLDTLGTFSFSVKMLGYTAALFDRLAEAREAVGDIADLDEKLAAQLQMSEAMLADIALAGASFRFEELGLVGKLLDFAADLEGISRDELVDGLAVTIPVLLMRQGDLAAVARSAQAASSFLAEPGTLELAIELPEPLSFGDLGLENPEAVPELPAGARTTITANGIGPIPLDFDGLDLEDLLQGLDGGPGAAPAPRAPHGLPAPGRDPRIN